MCFEILIETTAMRLEEHVHSPWKYLREQKGVGTNGLVLGRPTKEKNLKDSLGNNKKKEISKESDTLMWAWHQ